MYSTISSIYWLSVRRPNLPKVWHRLRKQIDECDDNIIQELAKRMRVAREIGTYKKSTESQSFKPDVTMRFWKKRGAQGEQCGMDSEFMKKIFKPSTKNQFVNRWKLLISS